MLKVKDLFLLNMMSFIYAFVKSKSFIFIKCKELYLCFCWVNDLCCYCNLWMLCFAKKKKKCMRWTFVFKSQLKRNRSKIRLFPREKNTKTCSFADRAKCTVATGSARTVQDFLDRVLLPVQKSTDRLFFGWFGTAFFFLLLRFQMYPFDFLTPKPTQLEFNWAYLIGLTWFILRNERNSKHEEKEMNLRNFVKQRNFLKRIC